ncbi:MAG: hypothetical protein L0154_03755, partial [Chloroflexi bacterium]|nr:hypothetical protein [Chloroflexota bacterium]
NYDTIEWEAGSISGGNANCIINPNNTTIEPPRAGFGDGATAATELPGSGDIHAFLDIDPTTGQPNNLTGLIYNSLNSSQPGRYRWCFGVPSCPPDGNPDDYKVRYSNELGNGSDWSQTELDSIAVALNNVALAEAQMLLNVSTQQEAFNRVMADGDIPEYIYFFRANDPDGIVTVTYLEGGTADTPVNYGACKTIQGNNVEPGARPRTIICNGTQTVDEFAIVHELGHVFNNRTASTVGDLGDLYDAVERTSLEPCRDRVTREPTGVCVLDFGEQQLVVMGNVFDSDGNPVWSRGDRGWGSGPNADITNFQQHPPGLFPNDNLQTQIDEAAADMFLNWTYRKIDPNSPITYETAPLPGNWQGFINASWRPDPQNPHYQQNNLCVSELTGCMDGTYPGDARDRWMNELMTTIFAQSQW